MRCANSVRYNPCMPLRILFALVVCVMFGSTALAADPIFPPGSRIGLVPPSGMPAATSFQGLEDRAQRVMLLVSEVSVQTYDKIAQDFTPEAIRAGGMEEVSRETLPLAAGDALLVGTRPGQNGTVLRKWALLSRSEDLTVTIVGIVPEAARDAYPDAAMRPAFA